MSSNSRHEPAEPDLVDIPRWVLVILFAVMIAGMGVVIYGVFPIWR